MTDPTPDRSKEIVNILIKLFIGGGSGLSIYLYLSNQIVSAVIAGIFTFGATLMTNFWQGVGDVLNPLAKKIGGEVANLIVDTISAIAVRVAGFESRYREALKVYCSSVEVEGSLDFPKLALADIFVPLRMESRRDELLQHSSQTIWDFLPRTTNIFPYRRIAIIADPGYGKTTLLRYLVYKYITSPPRKTIRFLPILLRLREVYTLICFVPKNPLETRGALLDLSSLIVTYLAEKPEFKRLKPTRQWFENRLGLGKCLVMLDGLDEVPKDQRDEIRKWVDCQMKAYPKAQFIVTSRPFGFEQNPDEPSYPIEIDAKLRVLDFNAEQKEEFIYRWYRAIIREAWERRRLQSLDKPRAECLSKEMVKIKSEEEAVASAKKLTGQLFALQSVNGLARNPLLITMIAATHRASDELPKRRVDLYNKICDLLLGSRPSIQQRRLTLTASENKRILQVLAWRLTEAEITQFNLNQCEAWIRDVLAGCLKDRNLPCNEYVKQMQDIAGFLVEKRVGEFEFTHLTFQEYFAACYLREDNRGFEVIRTKLTNKKWEEVICFYAALGDADPLIEAILEVEQEEAPLELANRCKNEGREVSPAVIQKLNQALEVINSNPHLVLERRFRNLTSLENNLQISEPITWGEYELFLDAQKLGQFHSKAAIRAGTKTEPVTQINREDGGWFCGWLSTQTNLQSQDSRVYNYRLPTQEELYRLINGAEQVGDYLRIVREKIPQRYEKLLNYLANKRWREADEETANVMLEVADRQERGYLDIEDIDKFPCEDLRIIDHLWVKFSGNRFGFSVQKKIYESLGGTEYYYEKVWNEFGDRVGWRKGGNWLRYGDLSFDLTAPEAHLPRWRVGYLETSGGFCGETIIIPILPILLSRRDL